MRPPQRAWRRFGDERGVALALALLVLMALSTLGLGFLATASNEPLIARNHADSSRARLVAEAGLEWALDQLRAAVDQNPVRNRIPTASFTTTTRTVPGLDARAGAFTVTVRNDARPADPALTGRVQDGADERLDGNNVAIVTSTGRAGTATRTVTAVFRGTVTCVDPDGAMNMPGRRADTRVAGAAFGIDGRDTRLDGTRGTNPAKSGIGVSSEQPGPLEQGVEGALNRTQKTRVTGLPQDPRQAGEGDNTIAATGGMTMQQVTDCVDALKSSVDLAFGFGTQDGRWRVGINQDCRYRMSADGHTVYPEQDCFGTRERPKITYFSRIRQDVDNYRRFYWLGSFSGWGPLIIDDPQTSVHGSLRWNGPIIVTGPNASIRFFGNSDILGTLVANKTGATAGDEVLGVYGRERFRYSREALERTFSCRYNPKLCATLYGWREL